MMTPDEEQLNQLLAFHAEALDISDALNQRLTESYRHLGAWLKWDGDAQFVADSEVYAQGSRLPGTMTAPANTGEDCDVDLVYRRDIARTSISKGDLKKSAGEQLARYVAHRERMGLEVPRLREKARCWTLQYRGYHMDILPALPDDEPTATLSRDAIIITDRTLYHWQSSNPKGYARWFRDRMTSVLRETMAKKADTRVEDIPEETVKTPLQRVVQLLKRHRDVTYEGDPDDKPISIIITTLAAHAFRSEANVYEALRGIVKRMPGCIKNEGGTLWVPNPVNLSENFADKWESHPQRAQRFTEWLAVVDRDLDRALQQRGVDKVAAVLGNSWGRGLAQTALQRYGASMAAQRKSGNLRASSGTATLGTVGVSVRNHTFFGDDE